MRYALARGEPASPLGLSLARNWDSAGARVRAWSLRDGRCPRPLSGHPGRRSRRGSGDRSPFGAGLIPEESETFRPARARKCVAGSSAAPVASLGVTSAAVTPAPGVLHAEWLQPVRRSVPPRSPQRRPHDGRGGLVGGSIQAVGRETGALLRLRGSPPIPHPFP